jgi:universal stress protein A
MESTILTEEAIMKRITRILVPTDFSATSDVAVDYAATLARKFDASIHLLHVVEDRFVGGAVGAELYAASVPALTAQLIDEAAAKLACVFPSAAYDRLRVTSEVGVGSPAATIIDTAANQECDLVVMGTHGRNGMSHLLLGSVAERIVRQAPCPVLTVRGQLSGAFQAEHELFHGEMVASA